MWTSPWRSQQQKKFEAAGLAEWKSSRTLPSGSIVSTLGGFSPAWLHPPAKKNLKMFTWVPKSVLKAGI